VRVLFADGAPARGVRVDAGDDRAWTDADGRASFTAVPVGPANVLAVAHGFSATIVHAEIGTDTSIEIREEPPRTVRVRVLDELGMPVPSAAVLAECRYAVSPIGAKREANVSVAQLDGDVEELVPLTDRRGVVELRVPRGEIDYEASLGNAAQSVTTTADDVEIVLRDPYRAPK
jgi:hypothetical protein